ncbi:MAG: LAGLIDADG family homing endonuclease [Halohasta sp.]
MAQAGNQELTDRFIQFYRNYYREEIGTLAQQYPNERRSLYVDYDDLYQFDRDLAEDYRTQPDQINEYAEEALRLYDLPADVKLGNAHVRLRNLPDSVDIRGIRVHDNHIGKLVSVQGIIRKATDVRPKITDSAFECQRCGTMNYIPQEDGDFQEPHDCQGCEREGPFKINFDQSEFVDAQKLRVQESPEGLRGGETPQSIDINIEDDITGKVTAGDHVTVVGVLHIEQMDGNDGKSSLFDLYMDGVSVTIEDEVFEDMDIDQEDIVEITELSNEPDIYEKMVASVAPSIYGYDEEKLAMILQLFSGVTKELPDGSRIRGDLHMLLIGDPGTGKCVSGDTKVTLADGSEPVIRELVDSNLDDPKPVDDGVWDHVDIAVPTLQQDGTLGTGHATKVWKREAPEQLYRITTQTGSSVTVTPSHPLFVQQNGQFIPTRAEDLSVGDFVAVPQTIPSDGSDVLEATYRESRSYNAVELSLPDRWTPELARLLGYIVAEGYVEQRENNTGFVSITNNDEKVLADATQTLSDLGLNSTVREPHAAKDAKELMCSSGEFVSFLAHCDSKLLTGSDTQRVPPAIQRASVEIKAAFLKAYIEGEGHVSTTQREISVASMSRDLLANVRSLLLSIGISSQLAERQNGSYRLRISGDQFKRYVDEVGFITDRKTQAALEHDSTASNTNRDVVPNIGTELKRIREALELPQASCNLPRSTYQHYERNRRNPSRNALSRVVSAFEDAISDTTTEQTAIASDGGVDSLTRDVDALRQLADGDVGWDKIETIETVTPDDDWVYDLEVEGTHNYLTNNVISHNSQMLSYIENIAPRSVYTSGKGSSSAGLTAAAVRDDFGDGQQWTLEAGALVLADKGIAAVDELDKMRCVTGDTDVAVADGPNRSISELAQQAAATGEIEALENGRTIRDVDLSVRTMTEIGAIVDRPVTAVHQYEAPSELIEVVTDTGDRLRSTPDHPFFVSKTGSVTERSAEDLSAGDRTFTPASDSAAVTDGGSVATKSAGSVTLRDVKPAEIVEVSRIENTDWEYVYDLTVEGTHNFIANGMVVHNSEDRSAMHEALEQQKISISKAGINATLKSRCSLLGAANPKYGRFDQYEPIGEQIDLEPALISRFDLIFTVTDTPDPDHDGKLADHILTTNYAGELNTQRANVPTSEFTQEEVDSVTEEVAPEIDAELLRKYIAHAKRSCFPTMTDEAKATIRDFYVDLRSKGADEDAPIPVTARKLEALVRLAEASARVRLSDTVDAADAERSVSIVRSCLQDIGVDPETGQFDADVVETGTSKTQRDRIKNVKGLIAEIEDEFEEGAPVDEVLERAGEIGMDASKAEQEIEKLRRKGDVYEPRQGHLRTT